MPLQGSWEVEAISYLPILGLTTVSSENRFAVTSHP